LCLDPDILPVTDNTVCIVPVHFAGMKCDIKINIPIIYDSAHRIERNSIPNITCFSFHPVKNLAMPSGGAIASNGGEFTELKARRFCGISDRNEDGYDVKEIGWNYYMNEISAAIGIEQLEKLDDMQDRRFQVAEQYNNGLDDFDRIPLTTDCSYHLYWLLIDDRKKFRKKMADAGIETGIHYKPIDRFSLYANRSNANLPVTREIEDKIVSIPMHASLTDQEVDKVIKVANS